MGSRQQAGGSYSSEPEEKYLHRYCHRSDVFWQDGVAYCGTCGDLYPPFEPVDLYRSEQVAVSTFRHTPTGEQKVILLVISDPMISVEEAEAVGEAMHQVSRIKVS